MAIWTVEWNRKTTGRTVLGYEFNADEVTLPSKESNLYVFYDKNTDGASTVVACVDAALVAAVLRGPVIQ